MADERGTGGPTPTSLILPEHHLGVIAVQRHGKTEMLQTYCRTLPDNLVIIDTAQRGEWADGWGPVTSDPEAIPDLGMVVWQPDLEAVSHPARDGSDPWSRGLAYIWGEPEPGEEYPGRAPADCSGGVTIASDEGLDWLGPDCHPKVLRMIVQGEGRHLGIWLGSQSNYGIHQRFLGGLRHRFIGRVGGAQERGVLESSWGTKLPDDVMSTLGDENPKVRGRGRFYYQEQGSDEWVGPFKRQDLKLRRMRLGRPASAPETPAEPKRRPKKGIEPLPGIPKVSRNAPGRRPHRRTRPVTVSPPAISAP